MSFRIIITTGGTGGHIFPAIAVAEALRKKHPDMELLFVGGMYGPEKDLAARAGLPFKGLPVRGFLGRGVKALSAGFAMLASVWKALFIVRSFRPDAVMGFGGYAAFASVFAAHLLGRPCALHEQNAVPGAANKILGNMVKRICLSWPMRKGESPFPPERCTLTGNPIRAIIAAIGEKERACDMHLLVMGGSQGAHAINNMVISMLPALKEAGVNIVHQTGAGEYENVRLCYMKAGFSTEETDTIVRPFIHDMAAVYASSSLALCRAGATTLAELAATGTPSVLIPFPFAAHDHQTSNAIAMQDAGGGILLPQKDAQRMCEEKKLAPMLIGILKDKERLASMRKGALSLARPQAANAVADELLSLITNTQK